MRNVPLLCEDNYYDLCGALNAKFADGDPATLFVDGATFEVPRVGQQHFLQLSDDELARTLKDFGKTVSSW